MSTQRPDWFYVDHARQQQGPLTADDLRQRLDAGQLPRDTLIWKEGMAQWLPALNVGEIWPAEAAAIIPKDEPLARMQAPVPMAEADVVYAGFWRRVAASWLDSFVLAVGGYIIMIPLAMIFGVAGALQEQVASGQTPAAALFLPMLLLAYPMMFVLQACYFGFMHSRPGQASLGKLAVGIKVTDEQGGRISFWRGFGRYFAMFLSALVLCIGFLMAAFTDRKRALHDLMCSTLVVDKWAYTAQPQLQKRGLDTVTIIVLVVFGLFLLLNILLWGFIAALLLGGLSR